MAGNSASSPPQEDEVEVSVFGPGYGESVLVHIGHQEWLLVDSCLDFASRQPVPLAYLRSIGVNPSEAVKLVVATHWHDDHIRGLGTVLHTCEAAQFVCSVALRSDEFLMLVDAMETRAMMTSSGVREFAEILHVLQERRQASSQQTPGPHWAVADRLLWQRSPVAREPFISCTVHSLSPSDRAVTLAYQEIAQLLPPIPPPKQAPKRRLIAQPPNHVAVVLWINIGNVSLLLGSDLEETKEADMGWSVIVGSTTRPQGQADVFKIPHHGSRTADHPPVWSELLKVEPMAVLTPFVRGSVSLPTTTDTHRICSRTPHAYTTAVPHSGRTRRRDAAVDRTIREIVRSIRTVHGPQGQVRLRRYAFASPNNDWQVDLFGAALPLQRMPQG